MESCEQKYKIALERAKQELKACGSQDCDAARQIFRLFPELKKSEDELVRAELIHFLEICQDTHLVANRKRDKWIEWLNKLIVKHEDKPNKCTCDNEVLVGYDCTSVDLSKFCDEIQEFSDMLEDKPKPYWDGWYEAMEWIRTHGNPFEKQGEQANKIEPKFKVGDWILIDNPCQIESIDSNGNYIVQYCDVEETHLLSKNFCDSHFHLWTIQDAKEGDVIEFADHGRIVIGIVSHVNKVTGKVDVNCLLDGNNFKLGIYYALDTIKPHPATKEQCDLLFQKIEEAGYKWDVEKKKLKKISQRMISAEAKEAMYDKPTDNDMVEALRTEYEKGKADAFAEMQKEWSEEDETTLACLLGTLTWATRNNYHCAEDIPKYMRWLETLKQRLNGTK